MIPIEGYNIVVKLMWISIIEKGDSRENAVTERVNGILKEEW